jgi:hypothetical protein
MQRNTGITLGNSTRLSLGNLTTEFNSISAELERTARKERTQEKILREYTPNKMGVVIGAALPLKNIMLTMLFHLVKVVPMLQKI